MNANFQALLKTKTFWASVVGAVTAVGLYYTGDATLAETTQTLSTMAVAVFLRLGLFKI